MSDQVPLGTRRRIPQWLSLVLGIAVALVGASLITRPFASLALLALLVVIGLVLTGIGELVSASKATEPRAQQLAGVAWIAAAIAVAVWPGLTLQVLAWIVGVALIIGGIARIYSGIRGTTDQRVAALFLGVASLLLGVLSLAWPDITVFVIGVVFGVRMLIFGISLVVDAIRGRTEAPAEEKPRGVIGRWARTIGAVAAAGLAVLLFGVSTQLNASEPDPDAFYDAPSEVPVEPGQLIRAEAFTRAIPDNARAWRILYTSERGDGSPALASGILVVPEEAANEPYPLITWSHGTTGQDVSCAPSLLANPFEAGAMFILEDVIDHGWAFVATDYIGLGADPPHAYLVGADSGRGVLDAARAARQVEDVALSDSTVVWGHSQGGGSALWAGTLATSYAPDAGVIGVAALSAASDLPALIGNLDDIPGGSIFAAYAIQGYSDAYDDVGFDDYVRGSARVLVREMADRCLAEKGVLVSVIESLVVGDSIWAEDPSTGSLGARLEENVPLGAIDVPLFMAQGLADPLVLPEAQQAFVDERCASGGTLEYRTYEGYEHVDIVEEDSPLIPDLIAWTEARWNGGEAISTC